MASQKLTLSAMQRLQKDIREMQKEPLPGIKVEIDADNPALMCLLLTPQEGPYFGFALHLSVRIPPTYPLLPPEVSIETPVPHPNVLGTHICCDLLEIRSRYAASDSYAGGYTPAYLLKYLFMQLLSFFSAAVIEQDYGDSLHLKAYAGCHPSLLGKKYSCRKCGFDSIQAWGSLRVRGLEESKVAVSKNAGGASLSRQEGSSKQSKGKGESTSKGTLDIERRLSVVHVDANCEGGGVVYLDMLDEDVWLMIFDLLSDQDLVNLGRASPGRAGDILYRYNVALRRELLCYFTRKTFKEAVLGVGVRLEHFSATNRKPAIYIEAFDLLSIEAFEEHGVRSGICGHKFTQFLPLALDDDHFVRAIPSLRKFLTDVNLTSDMSPTAVLYVIPKLMNTMIVNMMKVCDEYVDGTREATRAVLQASEKAFKGYCLLFHLLIKLSIRFPLIKGKVEEKLALFLSTKEARNKVNIPDLGEFVAMLPLALKRGYDWNSLCKAMVEELLTRNVMWVLRVRPELEELRCLNNMHNEGYNADRTNYVVKRQFRLQETFSASRTGLRLMMLQANFMRALVHSQDKLCATYGFPCGSMATRLVDLVKRIYSVGEGSDPYQKEYGAWKDFFTLLRYNPMPNEVETEEMLRSAIQDSKSKGYHGNRERHVSAAPSQDRYHPRQVHNFHNARRL